MGIVKDFIEDIKAKADGFGNEDELRYYFLSRLEEICRRLHLSPNVKVEETLLSGRSDARIGYVVFEFKLPGKLSSFSIQEEALGRLRAYIRSYANEKKIALAKLEGLVTDGKLATIIVYNRQARELVAVDWSGKQLDWSRCFFPIENCAIWLEQTLTTLNRRELSPENLLENFGPGTELCKASVKALWNCFRKFIQDEKTSKFYRQWEILFSTATSKILPAEKLSRVTPLYGLGSAVLETKDDVRNLLFVVHTYYALILKLLALRISDQLKLLGQVSLLERVYGDPKEGLVSAEKTLPMLYANIIEEDIFSWFQLLSAPDVFDCVRKIAGILQDYDVEKIDRDVLKRVYQKFIPTKLRKALGEFYTKDWVAELVLKEVGYNGNGRLLDPACGSGTFLAIAISKKKERLRDKDPHEALEEILSSIVGLDINPVAVITARVNYLLSLMTLLQRVEISKPLKIPVYLCDSVIVPRETYETKGMIPEYMLKRTAVGSISIPYMKGSARVPEPARVLLQGLAEFSKRSTNEFLEAMKWRLGVDIEARYRPKLRALHEMIASFERDRIDGIWARLIENFFAPLLAEPFDFVVGNPPWVAPVHVPKDYRDDVREIVRNSGFQKPYDPSFRKAKARFRAAERAYVACLPFTYIALKKYLKPSGKLAFLLTSSLAKTRNAGGWREKTLEYKVTRIVDLTLITDIHEGALCWSFIPIVVNENCSEKDEISYCYATRKGVKPKRKKTREEPPTVEYHEWMITPGSMRLSRKPSNVHYNRAPWFTAPPDICTLFRLMQKIGERLGDNFPIYMGVKPDSIPAYQIGEISASQTGFVEARFDKGEKAQVESELVYPLIKGSNISPWNFSFQFILVPHDPNNGWAPIPLETFKKHYRESYEHFEKYRNKLENRALYKASVTKARTSLPFYSIMEISTSKINSTKVAFSKHATQLKAMVVPEELEVAELGQRATILDTSAYFIATETYEKGLFVTAFLNSLPVRAFAYSIAEPKGGAPYKQFFQWTVGSLPVPRFKKNNPLHSSIIKCARELCASRHVENGKLDYLVQQAYQLKDNEMNRLQAYLQMMKGMKIH